MNRQDDWDIWSGCLAVREISKILPANSKANKIGNIVSAQNKPQETRGHAKYIGANEDVLFFNHCNQSVPQTIPTDFFP